MSYSFSVTASTHEEAKKKVAAQFAIVVEQQPAHKADEAVAVACARAFIDMLSAVPEGSVISVTMYGSVGWNYDAPDKLLSANVSVTANIQKKVA